MKKFNQLLIWQKGFEIAIQSFKLAESFQDVSEEQRMLISFMNKLNK
ncbi:MAG: hypothetical protein J7502_04580 [Flavisolibacter sp.]|nr:hypothetical protein [Flavisolibacter sp.]